MKIPIDDSVDDLRGIFIYNRLCMTIENINMAMQGVVRTVYRMFVEGIHRVSRGHAGRREMVWRLSMG